MKKRTFLIFLLIFAIGLGIGGWKVITYYMEETSAAELYSGLAQRVVVPLDATEAEVGETVGEADPGQSGSDGGDDGEVSEKPVLPEYAALLEENPDLVGWISIEGTDISYPVVQSPEEPNFYLTHGFDGEPSKYGCPYAQEDCDVFAPSDNVILYGHHMRNGSMFAQLVNYTDEAFYRAHPTLRFDTLTDRAEYEILAVVRTRADAAGLPYRQFVDAADEVEFDAYIERCRRLACYDTGVSAEYGDKLLTLSTCESIRDSEARLIVVAKRSQ